MKFFVIYQEMLEGNFHVAVGSTIWVGQLLQMLPGQHDTRSPLVSYLT